MTSHLHGMKGDYENLNVVGIGRLIARCKRREFTFYSPRGLCKHVVKSPEYMWEKMNKKIN
jgi:hypothetical protein